MKRHFLTGLIVLLPFAICVIVLLWIIDFLTNPFLELTKTGLAHLAPGQELSDGIVFAGRLAVLVFLFFFTALLGFLARKYLFSSLLKRIEKLFLKVPILRVIYKLSHDITKATFASNDKLFKQTVLLPFPHKDSLAIGLVTGDAPTCLRKGEAEEVEVAVFVPTSPHPVSGFILLTPKKFLKPIDLSAEDAFKYIISCGTLHDPKQTS